LYSIRHDSIVRCALRRFRNQLSFKHSSRSRPLKLSAYAFDVKPNDPATMAFVVAAILGIALIAGYVPARRASRVEVLTALPRD